MPNPKKWTDYIRFEGEGRHGVLSSCRLCGAAVLSEPWMGTGFLPFDLHERWHRNRGERFFVDGPEDVEPTPVDQEVKP